MIETTVELIRLHPNSSEVQRILENTYDEKLISLVYDLLSQSGLIKEDLWYDDYHYHGNIGYWEVKSTIADTPTQDNTAFKQDTKTPKEQSNNPKVSSKLLVRGDDNCE